MPSLSHPSPYRAQARTIRARLSHRPAQMHRALRDLNQSAPSDPTPTSATRIPAAPGALPGATDLFTQRVLDAVDGPILRYSVRQRLLKQADRLGIHRFEANLIIATVQHRRRNLIDDIDDQPAPARSRTLVFALLLQLLILLAACALFI